MPLCLTSSRNLPMPCGKTIMQIIYDCYIFLLMCLSLVWTRRTCIFSLYAHISFICMHMYVAEIWTCTLANLLKYGYVLWQTIFLNLMYLLSWFSVWWWIVSMDSNSVHIYAHLSYQHCSWWH
jgi:hypothetical protein